ncbi:MAG: hypothetical protein ACX939_07070, partial [Hyphococcus sp.]
PVEIRKPASCRCPETLEDGVLTLRGLVVDAELTVAADGRSANERQATIFNVSRSGDHDVQGRTRIWHSTIPANCGLTFDYGLQYTLFVRRNEDGTLETDQCLMRRAGPQE